MSPFSVMPQKHLEKSNTEPPNCWISPSRVPFSSLWKCPLPGLLGKLALVLMGRIWRIGDPWLGLPQLLVLPTIALFAHGWPWPCGHIGTSRDPACRWVSLGPYYFLCILQKPTEEAKALLISSPPCTRLVDIPTEAVSLLRDP